MTGKRVARRVQLRYVWAAGRGATAAVPGAKLEPTLVGAPRRGLLCCSGNVPIKASVAALQGALYLYFSFLPLCIYRFCFFRPGMLVV